MGLIAVGISHKTAPVELRERLTIPPHQLAPALDRLSALKELQESVILSTCNRIEIYARPRDRRPPAVDAARAFLRGLYPEATLDSALYQYEAERAVEHLFRVASGLDSMVVGETEILGQVKAAYQFSQAQGVTGKITNVLFQRALFVGKHVRTKTLISEGASSVGSIAVQLAEKIFGQLNKHRILLIGAGKMAEITARHLLSQKAGEIVILNRTHERAETLARQLSGIAKPMDRLSDELLLADIVVCSTSADRPILTQALVESVMKTRRGRFLYFIDIAVPRNVEPSVNTVDNVYLYNIDDLKTLVDENMDRRKGEVARAEELVSGLSSEFYQWIRATLDGRTAALKHGL